MLPKAKTIIQRMLGPMFGVKYPYRKTFDLYVASDGKPVFCCQCDVTFPLVDFEKHILSHDRRAKRYLKEKPNAVQDP